MSCILAPNKEMLVLLLRFCLGAHRFCLRGYSIMSYAELTLLTLACAHQRFAYAAPFQGASSQTWTQFRTWLMWQGKQIKIDDGNRMLYSITDHTKPISTSLWPPVSWERKSWMTLECEPTQAFPDIFWFWGAHPPPTCQSFAMQRSNGHCFNVCVLAGRGKGACFVTALQCPWLQRRSFVPSTHCVLYIPLHMSTDLQVPMVHDASKLLLYLPFPSQKRGVTPTPILSPKERDLGECINISRSLSTLENDKNKNIPCQSGDPLLLMRTLKALKTTKIDQNSLWAYSVI